ncbi:hypothetical protein AALO_G00002610 [Alosa alosa]|uniref:Uncharacterized protein n=1 Tax=Alosa alosa TaxID=278164 RepID=A0AAV6HFW3_9TELE|nr:hypothetical protein AALO_G00002610 [Alosa alosa]
MKQSSSLSQFFGVAERQWESEERCPIKPTQQCAVKRTFSGPLQLPRLSCRTTVQCVKNRLGSLLETLSGKPTFYIDVADQDTGSDCLQNTW